MGLNCQRCWIRCRRGVDSVGGPAIGLGGVCAGLESGGGAHQQGADRDPGPVRGPGSPNPRAITVPNYGTTQWADLFTARQLTTMCTFADLVAEAREQVLADGGDQSYADAIAHYLGLVVGHLANRSSNLCFWNPGSRHDRSGLRPQRPADGLGLCRRQPVLQLIGELPRTARIPGSSAGEGAGAGPWPCATARRSQTPSIPSCSTASSGTGPRSSASNAHAACCGSWRKSCMRCGSETTPTC